MIGVNMDVTEQVRHQEELRRANNMESLGLLAGGIAHDFNNLLMGIIAHTELLRFTHDGIPEVVEVMDTIGQAVDSARALTQQLLTFSKGGAPIRRVVSLDELVREQVTFSLRGSSTRAEVVSDPDLWAADVDPGQMAQVVQNLVLNADQAMPPGGEIQVRLANKLPESPFGTRVVEISVTDSGHGMSEEVRQKVFHPYFSTKPEGHGLGLSICHSIVERHGGSIRVESAVGEGTTFVIELPASTQDIGDEFSDPTTHQGEGRVLIVDDQDDVRQALVKLIGKLGFDTVGARCVDEAVELARSEHALRGSFDMVLTDLTMPGSQGGLDVVRRVKEIDPDACVVVLSGYAEDPVLRDFRHHGFDAALNKPVGAKELSRVLHALIGVPKGA
jgi:CheY-like chemotaxis protein